MRATEDEGGYRPVKALKRIGRIVGTVAVSVAVALAIAFVGVRLVGLQPYTVLSGSMEPTYHVGSLIYVKDVAPEEVEVGDPITFVLNEDLVVATHRVIEVDAENQLFYTQGDANEAPDGAPVHFNNLIGTPVFTIPQLGYLAAYVQEPPGLYVAFSACALFLMLMFLPDLFAREEKEERKRPARTQAARANGAGTSGRHARPTVRQARPAQAPPRPQARPAGAAQTNNPRQRASARSRSVTYANTTASSARGGK